ncbi:MAG: ATP-binding cassette domain-containing protein [Planctomycetes bacterium]|nr:ATP-binding cassette domain-containing protein [Planctomycetota bacterium]
MNNGVQLKGVSFRIGEFAIENLELSIRNGEYFVLTGPNGAGKTIIVKLIAGLLQPAAGAIRIGGESVTDLPPWERSIGYMPQDGVLFPNRSVRRNIQFGLEVRHESKRTMGEAVERTARVLGISHLLDRMPVGLSGGERQKVALARALVLKPSLLLLDEPLSAIDEETRDSLCDELRAIQRQTGVTTIHVSHNRKETQLVADRVGVLTHGAISDIMEVHKKA